MPDNQKPLIYGAFPVCRNYTVRAHLRNDGAAKRRGRKNRVLHARSLLGWASRWTPTPTSPPTHSSRRRKRWGASSPVRYRPFRYPLPLGSAFGSGKSSGRKQQLMQTKRPEALRFRVFLARREGFEPPAFWSVGCLKGKTEPFRLRFVLFTAVRSADFPLFPSSSARSNSYSGSKLGQRKF